MNTKHPDELTPSVMNVRQIARIGVFIALSAVGAMIKRPSPVGTIGLDAAPGFFCALAFGYVEGAAVIAIGHLLTSAVLGFPTVTGTRRKTPCRRSVFPFSKALVLCSPATPDRESPPCAIA